MKKFFYNLWIVVNSPLADIIGGYLMMLVGFVAVYTFSELTVPCFVAFVSGCLITIGFDCADHGFDRRRSSVNTDDNKNVK